MISIYIGNIPYKATNEELKELFERYGKVISAENIINPNTSRSRGFGIVKMEKREQGERAIKELNGQSNLGRKLTVKEDQPREQRRKTRHPQQSQQGKKPQQTPQSHHTITTQRENRSDNYFHNPYTFIPTPSRQAAIDDKGFAGDFNPLDKQLDHASLNKDLWTGHIPIKITTVTPLVLLKDDGKERKPSKHQEYDVHSRIPEPSLRGMLRSAYEVVTNSRYSSFRNNDRLAYRMHPREATKFIPTIVKKDKETNKLKAYLYTGSSHPTTDGPLKVKKEKGKILTLEEVKKGVLYAALLSQYNKSKITYPDGTEPKTRDEVYAELILCGSGSIRYWQTSRIWLKSSVTTKPETGSVPSTWDTQKLYRDSKGKYIFKVVEGTVLITNQNIDKKGNERIFFIEKKKSLQSIEIEDDHIKNWKALIKNYRDSHTDNDIFDRKDIKKNPKKPWEAFIKDRDRRNKPIYDYAWSPHLYHKGNRKDRWGRDVQDALDLKDGTRAYARCKIDDKTGDIKDVLDLFPVMISRELYECSPKKLLDESLRPATELDQLSPADRLFGWTPQGQGTGGGYKSRIRVICEDGEQPNVLESFDPLPLSILGQPKPEQGRFYVAVDDEGTPQKGVDKRKAGYDTKGNKQLRGRKHYWHHKGFEYDTEKGKDHWHNSNNQDREYIRKGKTKDTQNRSITGWIKPGEEFKVSLYVQNLEPKEVGALLWLFTLNKDLKDNEDKRYFRLGYGKPLGFGSVEIDIDKDRLINECLPLGTDKDWKTYYAKFDACLPATMNEEQQEVCRKTFMKSMVDAYKFLNPQTFEEMPFIKGLLRVLQGPDKDIRIHYPRTESTRYPDGKNYEWFVDNERGLKGDRRGKQLGLPDVNADNQELPYTPSEPKPKRR